jgi:saccharopine dehydrogenase-like NADP-dependent oxidoreductase
LVYAAAGRITVGTGVPASIGAMQLAIGLVRKPGVFPPEGCIEPEQFLFAIEQRRLGEIEEQVLAWDEPRVMQRG